MKKIDQLNKTELIKKMEQLENFEINFKLLIDNANIAWERYDDGDEKIPYKLKQRANEELKAEKLKTLTRIGEKEIKAITRKKENE